MQGFIEVVRSYPYLWQTDNKKYKNVELRECTWNRIAKQCDFKDASEAKRQWKHLRDSFRVVTKRQNDNNCGSDDDTTEFKHVWTYEEQMQFILPYMKHRRKKSNDLPVAGVAVAVNPNVRDPLEETTSSGTWPESQGSELNNTSDLERTVDDEHAFLMEPSHKKKCPNESLNTAVMIKPEPILGFNDVLLKDSISDGMSRRDTSSASERDSSTPKLQSNDSLKEFFNCMYLSTATLPVHHQLTIKRTLFDAVDKAERDVANNRNITRL